MGKKKQKKPRKKAASKGARATITPPAVTEVVSGIVRTLADKKFGAKLADKEERPGKAKPRSSP